MPTEVIITKSNKPYKKYDAVIDGKKTISFGQNGASDFTKHNDNDRKQSYMNRHRKNEDWGLVVLKLMGFMLNTFCGTNHLLNQVSMI